MSLMSFKPTSKKILVARNEFHQGDCEWHRKDGLWRCVYADECLSFLIKLEPITAKFELLKRGYEWEWLSLEHSLPQDQS